MPVADQSDFHHRLTEDILAAEQADLGQALRREMEASSPSARVSSSANRQRPVRSRRMGTRSGIVNQITGPGVASTWDFGGRIPHQEYPTSQLETDSGSPDLSMPGDRTTASRGDDRDDEIGEPDRAPQRPRPELIYRHRSVIVPLTELDLLLERSSLRGEISNVKIHPLMNGTVLLYWYGQDI